MKQIHADAPRAGFCAGTARRADDFGAVAPRGDHFRDQLGWILEVRIHGDDRVGSAGVRETGRKGGLKTEIPRELDELEARIPGALSPHEFDGAVAAAVVDQDGAPGAAMAGVKERREPHEEFGQHGRFIEDGHDEGNSRRRHWENAEAEAGVRQRRFSPDSRPPGRARGLFWGPTWGEWLERLQREGIVSGCAINDGGEWVRWVKRPSSTSLSRSRA